MPHERECSIDRVVSLTVDIDWAPAEVIADLAALFNERRLRATFFCTHVGIEVPGHERALHPNFRSGGDTLCAIRAELGEAFLDCPEIEIYRRVIQRTQTFCREAVGVRAHSLYYDSLLLSLYREAGLRYDSSYLLPLTAGLQPVQKEYDILELPIFYNDHFDLKAQATGFHVARLGLERPGMKIFNFHPNMVCINAASHDDYLASKPWHKNAEKLRAMRNPSRGARTLLLDLLDYIDAQKLPTMTLAEINDHWRCSEASRPGKLAG